MDNTVGLLQLLLSSISHARQLTSRELTFAPSHTRPSLETTVAYVCLSAGWLWGGHVSRKGQMSSTGTDDSRAYRHTRHLILKCVTSPIL